VNDILKKIDELIDKTNYELYKAGLEDAKDIILSQHKQLATGNNVVTKSGKDNNAKDTDLSPEEAKELKAERDYWEREAKKWCSKLGEIRLLIGEQIKNLTY
jgi:hypothetical protein